MFCLWLKTHYRYKFLLWILFPVWSIFFKEKFVLKKIHDRISSNILPFVAQSSSWNKKYHLCRCLEMEKDGSSGITACANFSQLCYFCFFHMVLKIYCLFCASFGIFVHFHTFLSIFFIIFCVLFVQARSFASAILWAFSICDGVMYAGGQ